MKKYLKLFLPISIIFSIMWGLVFGIGMIINIYPIWVLYLAVPCGIIFTIGYLSLTTWLKL